MRNYEKGDTVRFLDFKILGTFVVEGYDKVTAAYKLKSVLTPFQSVYAEPYKLCLIKRAY